MANPSKEQPEERLAPECENTEIEIWRERPGDYYSNSVAHDKGAIVIKARGTCIGKTCSQWVALALDQERIAALEAENERLVTIRRLAVLLVAARNTGMVNSTHSLFGDLERTLAEHGEG